MITSRVIVHDHLERQRTRSPRELLYVTTSRIVVRDHLERQHMCLPREYPRVQASVDMECELSEPEESQED